MGSIDRSEKMPSGAVKMYVSSEDSASYEQREKLRKDYLWISEQKTALSKDFLRKYIAVRNRKVVFAENNVYDLLGRMRASGIVPDNYAVEYLSEQIRFLLM
jgi:hypothetical protein